MPVTSTQPAAQRRIQSSWNPQVNDCPEHFRDALRGELDLNAAGDELRYGYAAIAIDELFGHGEGIYPLVDINYKGFRVRFTLLTVGPEAGATVARYELDCM